MLSYEEITKFVKNIFYANGRRFDETYLTMWIREISHTGADIQVLHQAEQKIIRNNIPLKVFDVCETITESKQIIALPPIIDCKYCNSKGYVMGIKFDKNGIYAGYKAALNCICGNAHMSNAPKMIPDPKNNHKTPTKDGYYRIFPSIVEETEYLDKIKANNWRDIR